MKYLFWWSCIGSCKWRIQFVTWKAQGESASPFSTVVRAVKGNVSGLRDLRNLNEAHRDVKAQIKQVPDNWEDLKSRRNRKTEGHRYLQKCEGKTLVTSLEMKFKTANCNTSEWQSTSEWQRNSKALTVLKIGLPAALPAHFHGCWIPPESSQPWLTVQK